MSLPLRYPIAQLHEASGGQLFALDFRATCFVPRSFVAVAMKKCQDTFDRMVATEITYPLSDDVFAMLSVSNYLVQFGRNELDKHGFYLCFATLTDSNTTGQHSPS